MIKQLFMPLVFLLSLWNTAQAQTKNKAKPSTQKPQYNVVHPTVVKTPTYFGISTPLRDAPVVSDEPFQKDEFIYNNHEDREINPNIKPPDFNKMPPDPNVQTEQGPITNESRGVVNNYAGQNSPYYPPDCNGTVNSDYYFQVVNVTYQIFNKSDGSSAAGPSNLNTIFDNTLPGADRNDGDPIVLWDEQADRWLYAEFSVPSLSSGGNDYMLIAVSTTNDPTGSWYSWAFDVDDPPDYMKFGIWRDGYYMATNTSGGNDIYVFERSVMITGGSNPQMIAFHNPNRPSTFDGFHCVLPLDNDGPFAPAGIPGQFITIADDGQGNPADELRIYELNADWTTPANSTFAMTQQLPVNAFSGNFTGDWDNIPQPGTSQKLDGLSTILMYRAQYRNFNGVQKIVCNHTIAESSNEAAIRWYQLENTGSGWSIAQQSTYNPDNVSRWNGSIAMNDNGEIGLGYSVSDGTSTYPGIRYCGQSAGGSLNTMDIAETTIYSGSNSQSSYNRWGDYSNISVDPSNGTTFWYTNEYVGSSTHGTRIASFTFPLACTPPSTQSSNISFQNTTDTSTSLSWVRGNGSSVLVLAKEGGSVDADPESGTLYSSDTIYGTGDEIGVGNYVVYTGNGTATTVTGLTSGTQYYFNVYEYFTADNCYLKPGLSGNTTTTGTPPCFYCSSSGNTTFQTSTTFVGFNTISKSSAKPSGYSDYTNISTDLKIGNSYNLSVRVNTDGSYTTHTMVWIDWNKDCDFNDPGEEYDLGTANNVSDGLTSLAPLSIIVPDDSIVDGVRMRVSTKYYSSSTSCETGFDGEVEDYTLNIKPGETSWVGNTTDWFSTSNWSNGKVPSINYIVTIPQTPTGGNFPEITSGSSAVCYKLIMNQNATIIVNGTLRVKH